ncbi:MAG TPA: hypothetical protein DCW29_12385 [Janthinobacterium sp.]|nr:hypothetical protein [Janthinobacterium sp.]
MLMLALALLVWLSLAVVNAENQRYAMMTKACADPVFKGEVDAKCMATIQSRPHWWNHLTYAMSHVRP